MLSKLFLLTVFFLLTFLSGCQLTKEDRDFYYSGWVNPNDSSTMPGSSRNYSEESM